MDRFCKGLVVMAVLVACVGAASVKVIPARWVNKDNWRVKLKVGMSPAAVKNVLGEPAYEEVGRSMEGFGQPMLIFYYQTFAAPSMGMTHPEPINPSDTKSPKQYLGSGGRVFFSLKDKGAAAAKTFDEPAWDQVASPLPGERPARKPPAPTRKLEQWEVVKNWRRLSTSMDQKAVQNVLGKPTVERENGFATQTTGELHVEWEYGTGNSKGTIKLSGPKDSPKGALKCYEWREPFWPVVEMNYSTDPNAAKKLKVKSEKVRDIVTLEKEL